MIDKIKNELNINRFKNLKIKVNNVRNKSEFFEGNISEIYERIFIVNCNDSIKRSFSYSDVLIGNIEIEYI
ncbi:MAG: Veg family protein [Bacilli bacterium]|jgi:uncharacterized protein Veg|nr:Veg family protein [Bacilli bacterium]MBQ6283018.1 Veg family protein [Bacilli bacterium]